MLTALQAYFLVCLELQSGFYGCLTLFTIVPAALPLIVFSRNLSGLSPYPRPAEFPVSPNTMSAFAGDDVLSAKSAK